MSDTESDFSMDGLDAVNDDNENIGIDSEEENFDEPTATGSKKRKAPEKKSPSKTSKKAKVDASPVASMKAVTKKPREEKGAPKKELTEKQGYAVILKYINEQNKPFSSQTIFENLHKEVKKAHVVRILAQLGQEGKVIEKEYGKSKIYFADQSQFPTVDEADFRKMDEEIDTLDDELKELQSSVSILRNELKELNSSMSDEDLAKDIAKMTEETSQMEVRVAALQGAEMIDPKELEVLRIEITKAQKVWRERRNSCREMVGNIAEGMDKRDEEVYEMVGLETEEDLGLAIPFKR